MLRSAQPSQFSTYPSQYIDTPVLAVLILIITSKELLAFGYIWLPILNLDYLSSHWVSFGYLSLSLPTFPYFSLALTSQEKQPVMCKNGQKYQNTLSMIKPISSVARICYPKLCPQKIFLNPILVGTLAYITKSPFCCLPDPFPCTWKATLI